MINLNTILKKNPTNIFKKTKAQGFISGAVRYIMLLAIGYIVMYPIFYMVSGALKSEKALLDAGYIWLPRFLTKEWFSVSFEFLDFNNSIKQTLILQMSSAIIEVFVCAVVAYGFARFEFKFKKIAQAFLILSLMIPLPMYGMSLALNYRSLDFVGILGLFNKLTGVDLRLDVFNTNFSYWLPALFGFGVRSGMLIYIYIQFFKGLPYELENAAYVDGAGPITTFFKIALPSSSVVITTVAVLSIIWNWNETYLSSLCFLSEKYPLSVMMMNFEQKLVQNGMLLENTPRAASIVFCGCLIYLAIPLGVYLVLQRKFIKSIDRVGITG